MRTVFLSSTAKDLSKHREAAFRAIEGLQGYHCIRMEDFGSWNVVPDDFCRTQVAKCDVFICIAGPLYGSLTPAGPSYTEREYDAAVDNSKPCLGFVTAEEFPIPDNLREPDGQRDRQIAFRSKLSQGRIITRFIAPEELAVKVVQALRNWEISMTTSGLGESRSAIRIRRLGPIEESRAVEFFEAFLGIGRSPANAIMIEDPEVSWEHGQILRMKGQYYYRHLSETSFTIIERRGAKITLRAGKSEETVLHTQDRVTVGNATLVIDFDLVGMDKGYKPTSKRPENP